MDSSVKAKQPNATTLVRPHPLTALWGLRLTRTHGPRKLLGVYLWAGNGRDRREAGLVNRQLGEWNNEALII